jgi:hypothetical protein
MGRGPTNPPQNKPNDHLINTKIWRRCLRISIAEITTLAKIRERDTSRIAIRVITNKSHPIRSYFMNNKIHDEYATKPRTIKPIFIRAIEYLGQLQIDVRRIETTPYYLRPP